MQTELKLREWQKQAIEYFFAYKGNAVFSVPTGAGKTFVAIRILQMLREKEPGLKALIVVPKNVILEKTWFPELKDNGIMLNQVGIYNGNIKEYCKVMITTNASVSGINYKMFDFLIFDEVHNAGTPAMLSLLNAGFKYKLGLSATPKRQDMKHWKIYEAFAYNVYEYSMKQALDDDVLNKFDFYDIKVEMPIEDMKHYELLTGSMAVLMRKVGGYEKFLALPMSNPDKRALMKLISERKKLVWNHKKKMEVVSKIAREYKDHKVLIFNQFNAMTNALYYYLGAEGVKCAVIHSELPAKQKFETLRDYKDGKISTLISTKMLDEGYNLPSIDVGIILSNDSTERQLVQRMGRVLRKKETKSTLIQVYMANTFEETGAIKRSEEIRKLCESYELVVVKDGS
jgi:superfamily II DNA or RNA helicase